MPLRCEAMTPLAACSLLGQINTQETWSKDFKSSFSHQSLLTARSLLSRNMFKKRIPARSLLRSCPAPVIIRSSREDSDCQAGLAIHTLVRTYVRISRVIAHTHTYLPTRTSLLATACVYDLYVYMYSHVYIHTHMTLISNVFNFWVHCMYIYTVYVDTGGIDSVGAKKWNQFNKPDESIRQEWWS